MQKQLPQSGWRYRHFKGGLYQIITLAVHTETEETMVVYQALYGDFKVYTRPLAMFLSETDLEKYPNVTQTQRFERVDAAPAFEQTASAAKPAAPPIAGTQPAVSINQNTSATSVSEENKDELPEGISKELMAFLDAESNEERYALLCEMADIADDRMIDTMAVVSDIVIDDGPLERRYQELKSCLRTRLQYESKRFPRHIS